MYLNFEDDRPEVPRVHAPISRFRGIELSLVVHALLIVLLLTASARVSTDVPQQQVVPEKDQIRFVHMVPPIERRETPIRPVEHSDLDRRSRTPVRPREAANPVAYSRGNSPEKVIGAPKEKPAAPETTASAPASVAAPQPSETTNSATNPLLVPAPAPPAATPADRSLGQSLRDLRRYLQRENLDNQRGGLIEDGPDIQFDSKGVEFGPWLRRFVAQVKSNWYVPQSAQILTGRVVLQFYVEKNGMITELRIVSPCDIEAFNRSSFNAIRNSNPTMALPPEYPLPRALFTVTFSYNERRER